GVARRLRREDPSRRARPRAEAGPPPARADRACATQRQAPPPLGRRGPPAPIAAPSEARPTGGALPPGHRPAARARSDPPPATTRRRSDPTVAARRAARAAERTRGWRPRDRRCWQANELPSARPRRAGAHHPAPAARARWLGAGLAGGRRGAWPDRSARPPGLAAPLPG